MKNVDYSGIEFNKIKVIKRIGTAQIGKKKRSLWLCECKCGNYLELTSDKIQSKKTEKLWLHKERKIMQERWKSYGM